MRGRKLQWLLKRLERLGWVWDLKQPADLTPRLGVRRVDQPAAA